MMPTKKNYQLHAMIYHCLSDAIPEMQMRIISLIPINKLVDVFMELPLDISSYYFNLLSENNKKYY